MSNLFTNDNKTENKKDNNMEINDKKDINVDNSEENDDNNLLIKIYDKNNNYYFVNTNYIYYCDKKYNIVFYSKIKGNFKLFLYKPNVKITYSKYFTREDVKINDDKINNKINKNMMINNHILDYEYKYSCEHIFKYNGKYLICEGEKLKAITEFICK